MRATVQRNRAEAQSRNGAFGGAVKREVSRQKLSESGDYVEKVLIFRSRLTI